MCVIEQFVEVGNKTIIEKLQIWEDLGRIENVTNWTISFSFGVH